MFATSHWASNWAMVASLIVDGIEPWLPSASSPLSSSQVRSSCGAGDVVHVAALGVGVLAVAGELDLLVADAGQLLEDLLEARREVGRVRVARDGVAHGVEDDAALAGRQQHAVAPGLHGTGC
jgi:hypothetical protein